jgi:hypothetical protein
MAKEDESDSDSDSDDEELVSELRKMSNGSQTTIIEIMKKAMKQDQDIQRQEKLFSDKDVERRIKPSRLKWMSSLASIWICKLFIWNSNALMKSLWNHMPY